MTDLISLAARLLHLGNGITSLFHCVTDPLYQALLVKGAQG